MSHDLRKAGTSLLALLTLSSAPCLGFGGVSRTYTLDADFAEGNLLNVNFTDVHDQLQLDVVPAEEALAFVVFAASDRGTLVRVNARTGAILGEYQTAPNRFAKGPSRTGIDDFGNVWVGNRDESNPNQGVNQGSVVKIGVIAGGTRVDAGGTPDANGQFLAGPYAYNTCVDRDLDGLIRTSRGLGNILSWPNSTDGAGGADGLVQDALDECILVYQRTSGIEIRTIAVDANNDVWAGGYPFFPTSFDKLNGSNGAVVTTFMPACGGNGGLVDSAGILWSESHLQSELLRYDPATGTSICIPVVNSTGGPSLPHGIAVDTNGFIWIAQFVDNEVSKYDPAGNLVGGFPLPSGGASIDRSLAVTPIDNHVWVGNSGGNDVSRLDNNGNILKVIQLAGGISPRGVSVDADGKVWVANFGSNNGMRIDPNGGGDGLGAVDLTVNLGANAGPENYRDFTAQVPLRGAGQPNGAWNVVFDSGAPSTEFGRISYTSAEPAGTSLDVDYRAANTIGDLQNQAFIRAVNGQPFSGVFGRFIEIRVSFFRATPQTVASPILFDLTVESLDGGPEEPVCETGQRHPGSLLIYPEFDNRAGDLTLLTVTNTNQDAGFIDGTNIQNGSTRVEFVYIGRYGLDGEQLDCVEFNRTELLTPNDTLTVIAKAHNPQQAQGYVYVFAKDVLTQRPIVHNHLIGSTLILNGLESIQYGHNAYSLLGIGDDGQETDVDGDGIRDLNSIEYSCTADQILVPRFIGQTVTTRGDLVLLNLTGGTEFLATIDFLIYNDNEEVFSAQKIFQCWLKTPLTMISNAFSQSFLANATNDAPNELFGMPSVETGWFRMDGRIAVSAAAVFDDPAFLAVYIERISAHSASDLPFEVGSQFNGDLLPTSPFGDESP